jgi:carboxypeptidase Taq
MQKIADIRYASAILQWDQETYMPVKGASFRGQQLATLSELSHEMFTSDDTNSLLVELLGRQDLSEPQKRNVELSFEDYTKQKRLPVEFVRKMVEVVNKSFHSWIEARKENKFSRFQDDLSKLVELKKQEANYHGYKLHPYDALLNDYEKGASVAMIDPVFEQLIPQLDNILRRILSSGEIENSFLYNNYPKDEQWNFGMRLLREMHFDFEKGRQDLSEHPFTTSFSSQDVRVTTRIDDKDFANMTWSCIHELGHALYEQGLPVEQYGLPLGEACSYSVHESQSRLWENQVGRSLNFWQYYYPILQNKFAAPLGGISLEKFYRGINKVQPSLVRTEADEVTYHFHIYIRYQLEKRLIEGSLNVKDIPAFWSDHYKQHLGINVPDDVHGALQDVHWSHGSFGYFPTYSLGSFYAAQFFRKAQETLPSLEVDTKNGKFGLLLGWLRNNIHQYGRFYTSEELCIRVCGESLNIQYFIQYLLGKYGKIYEF